MQRPRAAPAALRHANFSAVPRETSDELFSLAKTQHCNFHRTARRRLRRLFPWNSAGSKSVELRSRDDSCRSPDIVSAYARLFFAIVFWNDVCSCGGSRGCECRLMRISVRRLRGSVRARQCNLPAPSPAHCTDGATSSRNSTRANLNLPAGQAGDRAPLAPVPMHTI
jgi:hypothetical protein